MNTLNKKTLLITLLLIGLSGTSISQNSPNITDLENQLSQSINDTTKIRVLVKLAKSIRYTEPKRSLLICEEADSIAYSLDDPKWIASTLITTSTTKIYLGEFKDAAFSLKEAVELSKKNHLDKNELMALNNLAGLYLQLDAPHKAQEYFLQAYQKVQESNDPFAIAIQSYNLGNFYFSIDDHEKALKYFRQSLYELKARQEWRTYASCYINIALCYQGMNQLEKSQVSLDSCAYIISNYDVSIRNKIELAQTQGQLHINNNNPTAAIKVIKDFVMEPTLSIPDKELISFNELLSQAYFNNGQIQEAIDVGLSNMICIQNSSIETSSIAVSQSYLLAQCYAQLQNNKEAYFYLMKSVSLNKSLDLENRKHTTALALISHEIESQEKILTEKNYTLQTKNKIYQTILILLIPLLLILGTTIYYRIRLFKAKQNALIQIEINQQLEEKVTQRTKDLEAAHLQIQEAKERENTSLALLNQQHAQLLDYMVKKIEAWKGLNILTDAAIAQPVLNNLKSAKAKAEEWGSFMLHFERMHPGFAQNLQNQYPSLNTNDLKHCAYMRMGMTRKQVADTLHCSEDAVKLARTRIRKKLGLSVQDSLQGFINQI